MDHEQIAIRARDLAKHYRLYARPQDRLLEPALSSLWRLAGRAPARYSRDFSALRSASFDIRRGETVGILGRNGSGKSTLLQIVCGTLQPSAGTVEVNGRVAALLELGAGFNPDYTGRENVYLNATILGLSRSEVDERFDEIAAFADIGDFIDQPVKTYSSGMYVRLAFASAISVEPDVLVVDEALAVGDEAFQRKCFARIEQIQSRGSTILLVSHATQAIVQICSRAMLMDRGELLITGSPKTVAGYYQQLQHATPDRAARIRRDLLSGAEQGGHAMSPADPATEIPESFQRFDPHLRASSAVYYSANGARISELAISDADGRPANTLAAGAVYWFRYVVDFDRDCEAVGFAMLLKTVSGVELGGQATNRGTAGISVKQGERMRVSFPMRCQFLPGTYFGNAGVYTHQAGDFEQLHRVLDGFIFRVEPSGEARSKIGLFDIAPEGLRPAIDREAARPSGVDLSA